MGGSISDPHLRRRSLLIDWVDGSEWGWDIHTSGGRYVPSLQPSSFTVPARSAGKTLKRLAPISWL